VAEENVMNARYLRHSVVPQRDLPHRVAVRTACAFVPDEFASRSFENTALKTVGFPAGHCAERDGEIV
jgi:hypothetical protein